MAGALHGRGRTLSTVSRRGSRRPLHQTRILLLVWVRILRVHLLAATDGMVGRDSPSDGDGDPTSGLRQVDTSPAPEGHWMLFAAPDGSAEWV